jgi:hypothetical protein
MPLAVVSPSIVPDRIGSVFPYPDSLPVLTPEQYASLREDIRLRGVQVAVEVCAKTGEVLDGRARVEICGELRIRNYARKVVAGLDTDEDRRHHRLKANCLRRQLGATVVKGMVLAEMRQKPQSDRLLASIFGLSHPTIGTWRREFVSTGKLLPVKEYASANGKTFHRPNSTYATNASSASRASRLLNEIGDDGPGRTMTPLQAGRLAMQVRRERADSATTRLPTKVKLYEGRFQNIGSKIKSGSVDLIFTDPPYDRAWLDGGQWADLALFASRVLKPGGLLISYAGIMFLPDVMAELSSSGLTYHWTLATRMRTANHIHARSVVNLWKPLLLYSKGPNKLPETVRDFCEHEHDPKSLHEWEQPQFEAEFFMSKLLRPGSVVLDPCAGSGTTLIVAKRLGMTAIADQGTVEVPVVKDTGLKAAVTGYLGRVCRADQDGE